MPTWILVALLGYLFLAVTGVTDKFLVSKVVRAPVAYAFYTAITGPFSLVLLLFGGVVPNLPTFLIALAAGASMIVGIYFSYSAIGKTSVSRVVPIQGGLVPMFSFILAYLVLGERLTITQTSGFLFLVLGAVMISFRKEDQGWKNEALFHAALSALFFATTSVFTKYTFVHSNDAGSMVIRSLFPFHISASFITGLVWPSLGFLLPVLPILAFKQNRTKIFSAPKEAGVRNVALYYTSRGFGTTGGFLQKYAVFLGSVSVVNALQGMQFVFLLALTTWFSLYYPRVLKERINLETIALKLSAIVFISIGLFLITK
ncbi:MAG: EamA family transporter [Candidatus Doudnabacteria bacterium]|nr:EamA family transporter [Candidatus Doudnabacteria bacterium]